VAKRHSIICILLLKDLVKFGNSSLLVCMLLGYATMVKDIWPYLHCNCTKSRQTTVSA